MDDEREYLINFQPIGRRVTAYPRRSLLDIAHDAGISLASICGGVGICDSCKIRLINGDLSDVTLEEKTTFTDEELKNGYRLACQSYPQSAVTIEIPPESLTTPQRLQIEGQSQSIHLDPLVTPFEISIPEPTILDLRSDATRIKDCLIEQGFQPPISFAYPVIEVMSTELRKLHWHATLAMRNSTIISILPFSAPLYGLAVDVGTTKLAAYLCDLVTGEIVAKAGKMNPQIVFGEDVISRISYSNNHQNGIKILQTRVIDGVNQLIEELCLQASLISRKITQAQIVEAVVVGNTAMHHLFAGLPVQQLGAAPYVPAFSDNLDVEARTINLNIAQGAKIHLPPNIAGYVGADHVAMLLATDILSKDQTTIALDIGTNTEISLLHNNQLLSCSCASGPAFEGAHIHAGMRAAPGAIERVQIIKGELRNLTIDNLAPIGICGSGILDVIACLLEIGAIDRRGSMNSTHPSVRKSADKLEYLLVDRHQSGIDRDIVITRNDINEIQLAKGAIRTGIEVLLNYAGISSDAIEEFIIAGAFGSYINIPSAIRIGMFPSLPLPRFHQVGNAAGAGARQMLLSKEQRKMAEQIAKSVKYIELSTYPDFSNIFSKSLYLYNSLI